MKTDGQLRKNNFFFNLMTSKINATLRNGFSLGIGMVSVFDGTLKTCFTFVDLGKIEWRKKTLFKENSNKRIAIFVHAYIDESGKVSGSEIV